MKDMIQLVDIASIVNNRQICILVYYKTLPVAMTIFSTFSLVRYFTPATF
jgi:hypothetical protein